MDAFDILWYITLTTILVLLIIRGVSAETCMKCPICEPGHACAKGCVEIPCPTGGVSAIVRARADKINTDGTPHYTKQQINTNQQYNKTRTDIREWLKNLRNQNQP